MRYRLDILGVNQNNLLAFLVMVLTQSGFSIRRARISTKDGQVSDQFEITTYSSDAVCKLQRYIQLPFHFEESASLPQLQELWASDAPGARPSRPPSSEGPNDLGCTDTSPSRSAIWKAVGGVGAVGGNLGDPVLMSNGDVYAGSLIPTWSEEKGSGSGCGQHRHGYGMYRYSDSSGPYLRYTGEWENDKKHGFGTFLMRDGSAYVGQWRQNEKHGVGLLLSYGRDGAKTQATMPSYRYEGVWENDKQHGLGIEEVGDYLYCGTFVDGSPAGRGLKIPTRKKGLDQCMVQIFTKFVPLSEVLAETERHVCGKYRDHIEAFSKICQREGLPPSSQTFGFGSTAADRAAPALSAICFDEPEGASQNDPSAVANRDQNDRENMTLQFSKHTPGDMCYPRSPEGLLGTSQASTAASLTQYANSPKCVRGGRVPFDAPLHGDLSPKKHCTPGCKRRARSADRHTDVPKAEAVLACPMLWSGEELAVVVECLGVSPATVERIASLRARAIHHVLQMSNAEMSQHLDLHVPLERMVVRRALGQLLETDRRENLHKGRFLRDIMEDSSLKRFIIPLDRLVLKSSINQGGYGVVYRATLKRTSGKPNKSMNFFLGSDWTPEVVAVKEMLVGDHRLRLYELLKEAHVLASLQHKNICRFIGVCTDGQPKGKRYIVSEMLHCSLFDFIHRPMRVPSVKKISPELAALLGEGICAGLQYMHARSLVHADLKSSNILIDLSLRTEDQQQPVPRICDFGHSAVRASSSPHDRLCTPHWAAPEVLRGEGLGPAADIFSLGVLFWEMLAQKVPHHDFGFGHVLASVGWAGAVPDFECLPTLPVIFIEILEDLLRFLPSGRPSALNAKRRFNRLPRILRRQTLRSVRSYLRLFGCTV